MALGAGEGRFGGDAGRVLPGIQELMDSDGDDPGSPAASCCPSQPRGDGLPRRELGVQMLRVLLCFHCWQTAKLCCGSLGDV